MSFTPISTEPRPRLFILAGVPGCGKSTYARRIWSESLIASTDQIRIEMAMGRAVPHSYDTEEAVYDATKNAEVFSRFHRRLADLLDSQGIAVADATSLTKPSRDELIKIAAYVDAEAHLVFFANPYRAHERNAKRKGNALVPREAMAIMLENWHAARTAILEESYTSITIIEDTL